MVPPQERQLAIDTRLALLVGQALAAFVERLPLLAQSVTLLPALAQRLGQDAGRGLLALALQPGDLLLQLLFLGAQPADLRLEFGEFRCFLLARLLRAD